MEGVAAVPDSRQEFLREENDGREQLKKEDGIMKLIRNSF